MSQQANPLLYSFRRCPYAIRARMALAVSGFVYESVEVDLKNKPAALFAASQKGTVPVLILADGTVIDESLQIMKFALSINDPQHWLPRSGEDQQTSSFLIERNDKIFKPLLDKFKYHTRHPELSWTEHQANGEAILLDMEQRLSKHRHLLSESASLPDVAIFPFIRQWSGVKPNALASFPNLCRWLEGFLGSSLFQSVMKP